MVKFCMIYTETCSQETDPKSFYAPWQLFEKKKKTTARHTLYSRDPGGALPCRDSSIVLKVCSIINLATVPLPFIIALL